ncbi:hypothetical protein JXA32_16560 [Candidatus Sumerlaeota bacterium]|nr:hypothetical protein [Candidatus Sumerlaeota bacterium]
MAKKSAVSTICGLMMICAIITIWQPGSNDYNKIKSQNELALIIGGASGCDTIFLCPSTLGCLTAAYAGAKCTHGLCGCKDNKDGCNNPTVTPTCTQKTCA